MTKTCNCVEIVKQMRAEWEEGISRAYGQVKIEMRLGAKIDAANEILYALRGRPEAVQRHRNNSAR